MTDREASASDVIEALCSHRSEAELPKVRKRLAPDEEAFGIRMRHIFDVAKAGADLPLRELNHLLDHSAYEPRMAAMCILDFKAHHKLDSAQRKDLYNCYLQRHDRITTWDMVDRAAPRVVGGFLAGRSAKPLHTLARSPDPLRRRTAITAPLYFVRGGTERDCAEGFVIAETLVADPERVVHNAVGTFLKHAGTRDPATLDAFLDHHATVMPRAALRLAISKLDEPDRRRYLDQR